MDELQSNLANCSVVENSLYLSTRPDIKASIWEWHGQKKKDIKCKTIKECYLIRKHS